MSKVQVAIPPKLIPVFTTPGKRYRGAYGGRGSAKTRTFAKMAALRAYQLSKAGESGLIVCGREFMNSLDESSMSEVKEAINSEPWLAPHFDIGEKYIRTLDRRIEFAFTGLRHNLHSLKSKARIHLLWVDEAEPVSEEAWQVITPTIREHDSEIWVTWNPESERSATHKRFRENVDEDMIFVEMNWRDNPWFPEVLEKERLRDQRDRPDDYDHIWEGDFRTVVEGAIYRKEVLDVIKSGRIRPVPHDPLLRVHTVWDLGYADHTAIICVQRLGSEVRLIDYIEDSHKDLPYYVAELSSRRWRWGKDWLPHDGRSKRVETGKSPQEILAGLGRDVEIVPDIGKEQGILSARSMFPRCYFSDTKTQEVTDEHGHVGWRGVGRLIDCLRNYRRQINQQTGQPMGPLHDEYSDGADSFRYLSVIVDKITNEESGFGELPPMKTNWIV